MARGVHREEMAAPFIAWGMARGVHREEMAAPFIAWGMARFCMPHFREVPPASAKTSRKLLRYAKRAPYSSSLERSAISPLSPRKASLRPRMSKRSTVERMKAISSAKGASQQIIVQASSSKSIWPGADER
jgi:hypothetical protein